MLIVTFSTAVIGLDTQRTVVYQVFVFFLMLLLLSRIWSLFFRARITARRHLPEFGTVGERLEYRVTFHNESSNPQKGLLLKEEFENAAPTREEFLNTPEPGEEKRNAYDRLLLVYRWQWLTFMKRGGTTKEQPIPTLPPESESDARVEIMPVRRGYLRLAGLIIARPDPLNLYKACLRIPLPQSILILPKRYDLPPVTLPGSRKFKQGGVALASSIGESDEFVSLRDYRPGDPLRRIHWKSWAKTGKPIVKEYQDEYFVRHALILDTFQQSEYSDVFEEAVSVAASFACTVRTQESLLDLMFVGLHAYCFTAGRGLAHTAQMLEILASVRPCRDKSFSMLPPLVVERSAMLSGCLCILLAWDEERRAFIHALNALGLPLSVFVITTRDKQSLDPGPMKTHPDQFHVLEIGKIQERLAKI